MPAFRSTIQPPGRNRKVRADPMRIFVHDFGGYPFPIDLSRRLARRGHTVCHTYCASLPTTPQGSLHRREGDPASLEFSGLALPRPLQKQSFITRRRQEGHYGRLVAQEVDRFRPDVALSADTPLDAQKSLIQRCRARRVPFIFWVQDLLGPAAYRILRRKLPVAGGLIGRYYEGMEARLLLQSDAVVLITEDFRPVLRRWGVPDERMVTIENWGPLEDVPVRPKDNPWAHRMGLADKTVFLYSGTLGMKHNPEMLYRLAETFRHRRDVRVVVVSQGQGAEWLRKRRAESGLETLQVLPFQPFGEVPNMLASADVLTAILEPDASVFSVPSKVLAYFCAARPVLLAVPEGNLAARLVQQHRAGLVAPPDDPETFTRAAETLLEDVALRSELGGNGRRYAEAAFDLECITDRFEELIGRTVAGKS